MFRATKGSGVTITTILRNNAIETRPGNKIHHLREKRSACVHFAPDWKTRIGEDVTSRILDRVQGATKKNTSETPVLQRYAEIVPSVNRTAVIFGTFWMVLVGLQMLNGTPLGRGSTAAADVAFRQSAPSLNLLE